jgi:hypothetical protein
MNKILFTIDVEPDLHTGEYKGVTEGLKIFDNLCKKHRIKAIFFTTCDCIEKYPKIFMKLKKEGHEIALHAYRHERFDNLSFKEKEEQIKKSIACFKKYLKTKPESFRAPQHGIDSKTLDLLEANGFKRDFSLTPLNITQLIFFPKKLNLGIKSFFSPCSPYRIRKNLVEMPNSAFFMPFTSLALRIMPKFKIKFYAKIIKAIFKQPVFYCHSWDFIKIKGSKIDRIFPSQKFIKKLDYLMEVT